MKRAIAAAAVAAMLTTGCSLMNHKAHTDCRVIAKEMLYNTHGTDGNTHTTRTKRLSTTCGVFDVRDSLAAGWQSYDIWSQLEVGHVYDIETGSFRSPFSLPVVTKVVPR